MVLTLISINTLIDALHCQLSNYSMIPQHVVSNIILADCAQHQAPNDLKHAIFALKCALSYRQHLQAHIKDLRKLCIVSVNNNTNGDTINLSLRSGQTLTVAFNIYYPHAPGSVIVQSISSTNSSGRHSQEQLEDIRRSLNGKGFASVFDLYNDFTAELSK
jgi:hypothetical protein